MARLSVALIVIIGNGDWWSLRAQDTTGIYFSARGFTFDSYFKKAILTSDEEHLSGKGAFLLAIADSIAESATTPELQYLNLHRFPSFAGYVESPSRLPQTWRGLLYIQRLELHAQSQKAVYARSNRLYTERFYTLSAQIEGIYFTSERPIPISITLELPAETWRSQLIANLVQHLRRLDSD